jgi:hypothetical protein
MDRTGFHRILAELNQPSRIRHSEALSVQSSTQHNTVTSASKPDNHPKSIAPITGARDNPVKHRFEERNLDGVVKSEPRSDSLNSEVWKGRVDEPKPVLKPGPAVQ